MAKNDRKKSSKIKTAINEKNLMLLLAIVLVLCVGYLFFQENKSAKILEPSTIEQTPVE